MITQLSSTNPNFSWLLQKNPASGMMLKAIKSGYGFGFFQKNDVGQLNEQVYNLYFEDEVDETSFNYRTNGFEYLDRSRYASPLAVLNLFKEFLDNTNREYMNEYDEKGYTYTITIAMCNVDKERFLEFFMSHFQDCEIHSIWINYNNYQLSFTTYSQNLTYLLNVVKLFSLFCVFVNKDDEFGDSSVDKDKYLDIINLVDAPYFIRYLFKLHFLNNRKTFLNYQETIETNNIKMVPGNTWDARFKFVNNNLTYLNDIIDLGCGEGKYASKIVDKFKGWYYAIDTDEKMRERTNNRLKKKGLGNAKYKILSNIIDEFPKYADPNKDYEVICSEVVEHLEYKAALKLIEFIAEKPYFKKLILTTPNKEFNQYYKMMSEDDERLRNEDHQFELTEEQFRKFIGDRFGADKFDVQFVDVGDVVDGHPTQNGVVIERKTK